MIGVLILYRVKVYTKRENSLYNHEILNLILPIQRNLSLDNAHRTLDICTIYDARNHLKFSPNHHRPSVLEPFWQMWCSGNLQLES